MEKSILYLIAKLQTAMVAIFLLAKEDADITVKVITALSFACVFLADYLSGNVVKYKTIHYCLEIAVIIACFILGLNKYLPLFAIVLIQFLDRTIEDQVFYIMFSVVILLCIFIFPPNHLALVIMLISSSLVLYCRYIIDYVLLYRNTNEEQKELITELNKKLVDLKRLTKTLKYTTSLEERNRIAARIHDQIGHGISGSIILLEASLLVLKDNPSKAKETVQKVINNLRQSVDEIRIALREERSDQFLLGVNDIKSLLEEFQVSYDIQTELSTIGDISVVPMDVWLCVHDNLKECLTNVLKHSNASRFTLCIQVFQKIIKVEYKDNGRVSEGFIKGLGLNAIEERTIHSKGKCFINKSENGFGVTNIFTY